MVALLAIIVIGFLLRIVALDEHGLNPDEAQFVWVAAAETLGELWQIEKAISPHPPALFLLLHGILQSTWSLFWLRLPSAIGGTVLIWITHRFTRQLFGPTAALAAAFLVAFSPGLIDLSRVCRNYGPAFPFFVASLTCLAAFVKAGRWRDYVAFSLLATLSVFWHYAFAIAYVGLDLALAILLLWRRSGSGTWARIVLYQLPLAGALLFLYVVHVSGLDQSIDLHQRMHAHVLGSSVSFLLTPISGVWRYLMWDWAFTPFLLLTPVAIVDLWIRGRRKELLLCLAPLLLAYLAGLASLMPFGDKRQSSYLFPFLFALVASQAPQLASGYADTRIALRRAFASWRARASDAGVPQARGAGVSWIGAPVLVLLAVLVLYGSFDYFVEDHGWYPFGPGRRREAMRSYPQAEVVRAHVYLAEHVGDNDMVMLGFQGLMALRMHFELSPILEPTPKERRRGDIRLIGARTPLRHKQGRVRYFWSGNTGVPPHT